MNGPKDPHDNTGAAFERLIGSLVDAPTDDEDEDDDEDLGDDD
jgi:hypothetical protein